MVRPRGRTLFNGLLAPARKRPYSTSPALAWRRQTHRVVLRCHHAAKHDADPFSTGCPAETQSKSAHSFGDSLCGRPMAARRFNWESVSGRTCLIASLILVDCSRGQDKLAQVHIAGIVRASIVLKIAPRAVSHARVATVANSHSKTAMQLLHDLGDLGPDEASDSAQLLKLVDEELYAIAEAYLRRERRDHTLQPTALVNEAYMRLVDVTAIRGGDRGRFMSIAARAMRRVLVDYARRRLADKRGGHGWQRVSMHPELMSSDTSDVDILELHEVLERFALIDERASRVVELRFFAGLSIDETAEALGVSDRTVDNDWYMARAWLARELSGSSPN